MRFLFAVLSVVCLQATAEEPKTLPFAIADEKKLDEDELKEKKEGWFVTGLPQISSDPVNGLGIGADGFVYFNGDKKDPFFEYTPYRSKIEFHLFATNKAQKQLAVNWDVPYVFNSKWRLRIETSLEDNPNLLYFGQNNSTMGPLSYLGNTYGTYSNYANAISGTRAGGPGEAATVTDLSLNTYRKQEAILNISTERSFWDSKMRLVAGFEVAKVNILTFDGLPATVTDPTTGVTSSVPNGISLLTQDKNNLGVLGVGGNLLTMLQFGIVYDTRDLEPDPSRGVFLELTEEISTGLIGSAYNFAKTFLHGKYFIPVLPSVFNHLIFAARAAIEYTGGGAPFFEYQDGWSTEGSIEGLGGLRTLRGYKQNRFLARWMTYLNFELRWRFYQTAFWGQTFGFMFVPFLDTGRVWDKASDLSTYGFRANGGAGLRIAWDQSTVLMFDYAMSSEDRQFFFNFGHIF